MDIKSAHKFSSNHKKAISESKYCGCLYCLEIFPASEVQMFVDEGETAAACPKCMMDAVICDKDVKFDRKFLEEMNKYWF
mgnify:FL=1